MKIVISFHKLTGMRRAIAAHESLKNILAIKNDKVDAPLPRFYVEDYLVATVEAGKLSVDYTNDAPQDSDKLFHADNLFEMDACYREMITLFTAR